MPGHVPVLKEETVQLLLTDPNGTYVDATLGAAGHPPPILQSLGVGARLARRTGSPVRVAARALFGSGRGPAGAGGGTGGWDPGGSGPLLDSTRRSGARILVLGAGGAGHAPRSIAPGERGRAPSSDR